LTIELLYILNHTVTIKERCVKRLIDQYLLEWKTDSSRKSLLVRGARQIGKTYAIRQLGKTYKNFVEINFENRPDLISIFDLNFIPERIIKELSEKLTISIDTKNTLLFFDEIQVAPKIIIALRYFYEEMNDLHVVAAGSLVDFAIQQVGMPVGRVESLYMYPVSFLEFLWAIDEEPLAQKIMYTHVDSALDEPTHQKLLGFIGQYIAVGGMPEAIMKWKGTKNLAKTARIKSKIVDSYHNDFNKYAKEYQIKYLNDLFKFVPQSLGDRFKYENVPGQHPKQELVSSLELLETAGIVHKILRSAGQGLPVGAMANHDIFKVIFLDIALSQAVLKLKINDWLVDPLGQFVNKGGLVEAFIGQELLAYSDPVEKADLYYWQKEDQEIQAEVDYLIQQNEHIIPIEVKSGPGTTLKSLHVFLEKHPESPYGIKFSTQNYSVHEKIHSYPLYAVAAVVKHYWKD